MALTRLIIPQTHLQNLNFCGFFNMASLKFPEWRTQLLPVVVAVSAEASGLGGATGVVGARADVVAVAAVAVDAARKTRKNGCQ